MSHKGCYVYLEVKMDRDLVRLRRRQAFVEKRKGAHKEVMKNHPEGITKDNLEQIKKELKKKESSVA